MAKRTFSLTAAAPWRILDALSRSADEPAGGHLTEEEALGSKHGTLSPEQQRRVARHLDSCPGCAGRLESLLRAGRHRASPEGVRRKQDLRRRLLGDVSGVTGEVVLKFGIGGLLGLLAAETRSVVSDRTEDGSLEWRVEEERLTGDLVVRVGSSHAAAEGHHVLVKLGPWREEVVLARVAPDSVGVEVRVPGEVRRRVAAGVGLEVIVRPRPGA